MWWSCIGNGNEQTPSTNLEHRHPERYSVKDLQRDEVPTVPEMLRGVPLCMTSIFESSAGRLVMRALLVLVAIAFIGAGANHFRSAEFYRRIIPPQFPAPSALVVISGLAEIAGGIGLLIPRLRCAAGWGLIALLIAVFPANVYMAVVRDRFADLHLPGWAFWARLPLQGVLVAWVWYVSIHRRDHAQHA